MLTFKLTKIRAMMTHEGDGSPPESPRYSVANTRPVAAAVAFAVSCCLLWIPTQQQAVVQAFVSPPISTINLRAEKGSTQLFASWNDNNVNNNENDADNGGDWRGAPSDAAANGYPDQQSQQQSQQSIGDVVLGLHGGKYQFDDPAINFAGQQFAEDGYSSGDYECYGAAADGGNAIDDNEPMPRWAERLRSTVPDPATPTTRITLSVASPSTTISIANEERSWEKFYAFLIASDGVDVSPQVGTLAPRGSSSGMDVAQLTITRNSDRGTINARDGSSSHSAGAWLIVGTEEASWCYQLEVTDPP